jgi:hypothetical protein
MSASVETALKLPEGTAFPIMLQFVLLATQDGL